jgi:hypothetical protein
MGNFSHFSGIFQGFIIHHIFSHRIKIYVNHYIKQSFLGIQNRLVQN